MAKKQQSKLSYGPNLGLIGGARDVARSEAMIDSASGAFASGLTGGIVAGIQEKEKNNAIRDAYINDLKSIDNVYKLDQSYNKKAVNDFVFAKKDAYAAAADCFAKTKDQGCRETMEEIKFSFSNLNQQLELLMGDRKEYLDAYDKGQVVDLLEKGDGIYASAYTNKGQFQIEENGNIGFNVDGKYTKFNDIAGKWNVNNNIYKTAFLKLDSGIVRNASRGGKFDKIGVTNQMSTLLSSQGVEEMQVALKANVVGDEKMIIGKNNKGEPVYAGNLSFESIWSKGQLESDFYKGYEAFKKVEVDPETGKKIVTYDTKWMFENTNSNEAIRLKSMYDANVFEQRHNDNFVNQNLNNNPNTTNSSVTLNNLVKAWKSGNIIGLKLPYGRSIGYDEEAKEYILLDVSGKEKSRFTTPDNDILIQLAQAHGVQPVDINKMDFTKPLFKTEVNNEFADPAGPKPLPDMSNRGMYQEPEGIYVDVQND